MTKGQAGRLEPDLRLRAREKLVPATPVWNKLAAKQPLSQEELGLAVSSVAGYVQVLEQERPGGPSQWGEGALTQPLLVVLGLGMAALPGEEREARFWARSLTGVKEPCLTCGIPLEQVAAPRDSKVIKGPVDKAPCTQ